MAWTWLKRWFGSSAAVSPANTSGRARRAFKPDLMAFEDRLVPAVSINKIVPGAFFDDGTSVTPGNFDPDYEIPADPSIAVGPTRMLQFVDSSLLVMDRGGNVLSKTNIFDIFQQVPGVNALPAGAANFNTTVVYDELSQRFYGFFLINNAGTGGQLYYFATTNATPLAFLANSFLPTLGSDIAEIESINLTTASAGANGVLRPVGLRVGYNREAVVVSVNMVGSASSVYDSTQIVAIDKVSLNDGIPAITAFNTTLDNLNYGLTPARMHDAPAGAPMYFVGTQGIGGNGTPFFTSTLRTARMTNILSLNPVFEITTIAVPNFGNGPLPAAPQPDDILNIGDTRITDVAWRGNRLVAVQTARIGAEASVRWFEFDTKNRRPGLHQSGTIDPGPGAFAYFPAIEISAKLDIGITYVQSSATEFMSVYVTGRTQTDPKGKLQTPKLLFAGEATYRDANGRPYLPGTYSSIAVDPRSPNSFWTTGMYGVGTRPINNWATVIGNFNLSPLVASPLKLWGPVRWTYDRLTDSQSGTVTFMNVGAPLTGTLILQITLPDPAITLFAPAGVRINNVIQIPFNGTFGTNQPVKFPLTMRNPNKLSLGTFNFSVFSDIV